MAFGDYSGKMMLSKEVVRWKNSAKQVAAMPFESSTFPRFWDESSLGKFRILFLGN